MVLLGSVDGSVACYKINLIIVVKSIGFRVRIEKNASVGCERTSENPPFSPGICQNRSVHFV